MRVSVDKDLCIGCGLCESVAPEVFEMKEMIAVVRGETVPGGQEGAAKEALESCPVSAIKITEE